MHARFTLLLILLFCGSLAMAQPAIVQRSMEGAKEFAGKSRIYGARLGTNFSTLFGDTYSGLGFRTGLVLGGFVQVGLNEKFSVQGEANISMEGAQNNNFKHSEESTAIYQQKLKYNYLQFPILVNYALDNNVTLTGGIQTGIKLAAKESRFLKGGSHNEDIGFVGSRNYTNRIKIFYPTIVLGASYPLPFAEGLQAQARLQTSIFDNVKKNATQSDGTHPFVFQLTLSYNIKGE
ncbi:MAG: PorT family protein [Bacteroidia bacterium]|nr:PorT family protein [Bacteroidia bacterium]